MCVSLCVCVTRRLKKKKKTCVTTQLMRVRTNVRWVTIDRNGKQRVIYGSAVDGEGGKGEGGRGEKRCAARKARGRQKAVFTFRRRPLTLQPRASPKEKKRESNESLFLSNVRERERKRGGWVGGGKQRASSKRLAPPSAPSTYVQTPPFQSCCAACFPLPSFQLNYHNDNCNEFRLE
jgi:hypothetical protein